MPPSRTYCLTWQFLAFAVLLLAPSVYRYGIPLWMVEPERVPPIAILALVYLATATLLVLWVVRFGVAPPLRVLSAAGSALFIFYVYIIAYRPPYSRRIVLTSSLVFVILVAAPYLSRGLRRPAMALLVCGSLAAVGLSFASAARAMSTSGVPVVTEYIPTGYHTLKATYYRPLPQPTVGGGGVDRLGDDYLLVTGDGRFFRFGISADRLWIDPLPLEVPINRDEFLASVDATVHTEWFRVSGLLAEDLGDRVRIVVAHHFWVASGECFVLRFSELLANEEELTESLAPRSDSMWRTLYETQPCLPLKDVGAPFAGNQSGGRIAAMGDGALVVTVGDHEFDGLNSEAMLPQETDNDYGKTLIISQEGEAQIFTTGHRNPQGLYVDLGGDIWLTEHGPSGGDELNLLTPDTNYGWPVETYGTAYGELDWPLSPTLADPSGLRRPEFAWTPAIGISNLLVVRNPRLGRWNGDLLVAGMRTRSLYRLQRDDGRIVLVEPIPVGRRIRDLTEGSDGRIVAWSDRGWIITFGPAEEDEGADAIRMCTGCHTLDGAEHGLGPNLRGVLGRQVAAAAGYSFWDGLRSLGVAWTAERLDAFLADPQGFAPGTTMRIPGIRDRTQRAALLAYLRGQGD